jgi:hypothetical protein
MEVMEVMEASSPPSLRQEDALSFGTERHVFPAMAKGKSLGWELVIHGNSQLLLL